MNSFQNKSFAAALGHDRRPALQPADEHLALLVVPALLALLIAGAGLWAAFDPASRSRGEAAGMIVLAVVFGGFAAFLLALWRRERRSSAE